jgi:hypothetical protein
MTPFAIRVLCALPLLTLAACQADATSDPGPGDTIDGASASNGEEDAAADVAPTSDGAHHDAAIGQDASVASDAPGPSLDSAITDATVTDTAAAQDAGPGPDGGTACNALARTTVTPVAISGFGDLHGGTILDGAYTLTSYVRYITGSSGTTFPPISLGLEIQGGTIKFSTSYGGGVEENYTFTTSGYTLHLTRTCPAGGAPTWYYDAQGGTLTLYEFPGSNSIWYATFHRNP